MCGKEITTNLPRTALLLENLASLGISKGAHKRKGFVFNLSTFSAKRLFNRATHDRDCSIVFLPVKAFSSRQETHVVSFSPFF